MNRIARHYHERRYLSPLAMQTRNQSRRRGSSIGDPSESRSSVQKTIQATNKKYITSRRTYSSTHPLLDSYIASRSGRSRSSCGYRSKCFSSRKVAGTQIGDMEKSKVGQSQTGSLKFSKRKFCVKHIIQGNGFILRFG